jgi:DNA-binding Lrp family transcriptional regulator
MTMLDEAARRTDQADLVILAHLETIRDQEQPSTASAVAALIGGAPALAVLKRIHRLEDMGLIETAVVYGCYRLTAFGAELLRRELVGWTPSEREERRRDEQVARALAAPRRR